MIKKNQSKTASGLKSRKGNVRTYSMSKTDATGRSRALHRSSSNIYAKVIRYYVTSQDDETTRMIEASKNLRYKH